jgi:hypothetical protein
MEVMFHFIFELIKISILGCIYSTFTLVTFKLIGRYKPDSWFDRVSKKKLRLWILSGLVISVGLFLFMFTYFGDHGLGDSAKVPIGHFKVVRQINGSAYLQNSKGDQLGITNFNIDCDRLYTETQREFNGEKGDFVVWDLRDDSWTFYRTKDDYLKVAKKNNYPTPETFEDFFTFYKRHWYGWRFWLLP